MKNFSRMVAVFFAAIVLLFSVNATAVAERVMRPDQPNIVVFLLDDARVDDIQYMPFVQDYLVKGGTTFKNSFVVRSLCCPSRATLLSGQYPHNNGVKSNKVNGLYGYQILDQRNTLPIWLQDAGYYTGHFGKYLNGYGVGDSSTVQGVPPYEIPQGWDIWQALIDPSTYDYVNFRINHNNTIENFTNSYSTDVLGIKAVRFLNKAEKSGKPFYLSFNAIAPHSGGSGGVLPTTRAYPALRHLWKYRGVMMPTAPSFNEADVSDKPNYVREMPSFDEKTTTDIMRTWRRRVESLLAVDEAIAAIVGKLESIGQIDNTVIILTSDNGFMMGEHRLAHTKQVMYEESYRVPFVIRGPGIPKGATVNLMIKNIDWAPTILDLADARATYATTGNEFPMDGASFAPILYGDNDWAIRNWTKDFIMEGYYLSGEPKARFKGVHTKRYSYVIYDTGEKELYDLLRDPYQMNNKINNPKYAGVAKVLQWRFENLRSCVGEECRDNSFWDSHEWDSLMKVD
ncbi:MAG: sulfatase [Candidatus Paceibacterota bacterium]